jgi:hypothetical protein
MRTILSTLLSAALSGAAFAQVPSLINYQGRLTAANGSPVTGSKTFAISIYDAATGGNVLYTESIGAVTLDANGVYSFQFGGTGTSNTLVSETIATTNGTSTTFQKVLANSPVVAGTVSVTDGTYTWTQSAGSSNEDEFGVAYSNSLRRVTANYYAGAPTSGKTITATYRYGTSGVTGALSSGAEHWMAISVDGTPQATRQRVLAVPFALRSVTAEKALSIASYSLDYRPQLLMSPNYSTIYRLPVGMGGWSASEIVFDLPLGAEKIESIDLKYSLDYGPYSSWGSGGSAYTTLTAKLIRRAAGATEEIVSSFTDQSTVSRNGLLTRSWTLNHKLDPAWIYYISLTTTSVKMGDYNTAPARGINDILVRW